MRIGIFSDAYIPLISGVVTSITMLLDGLSELGHEVFVFTTDLDKNAKVDKFEANVIKFSGISVPIKALNSYKLTAVTRNKIKKIEQFNLDVIHVQTEFTIGRLGIIAGRKLNIPVVYTFHTLYEDYLQYVSKSIDKHFHKQFLKSLSSLLIGPINETAAIKIVPTKKVLTKIDNYQITGDVRVVPSGLELERFYSSNFTEEEKIKIRKSLNINENTFIFLSLGRISKEKSIDVVITAYSKVCRDTNSKLLIVGDGPYLTTIKDLVKKLEIEDYVIFTGFIAWDMVPIYYQISNVFVNASKSETQGLTYIEALASSLPVLVQKDECLDEVIDDGNNGMFFDGEKDMQQKILMCIKNQELMQKFKVNSSKSVEKFSKMCYATTVLQIYEDAIKTKTNDK